MQSFIRFGLLLAGLLVVAPFTASEASAQVSTHDAHAFLGDWNVAVQGDMPTTIRVNITDNGGQVAAVVTGIEGNATTVETITKSGENLVLRYNTTIQGQALPIAITLTPDGENLRASIDLASGMMTVDGTGTKRS